MGHADDTDLQRLMGRWIHAHEEDRPGEKVYRSESVPLPPSRGRGALDLSSDGTASREGIAADDRAGGGDLTTGRWTLTPDQRVELVFDASRRGTPDPGAPRYKAILHLDASDPTRLIEER